jgi:hypothetical protein
MARDILKKLSSVLIPVLTSQTSRPHGCCTVGLSKHIGVLIRTPALFFSLALPLSFCLSVVELVPKGPVRRQEPPCGW